MIKKIVIKNLNTSLSFVALGKLKFYDSQGNIIESGNTILDLPTETETDNFIYIVNSSYIGSYPSQMINYSDDNSYWMADGTEDLTIEIHFKKLIDSLGKISFVPLPSDNTTVGITQPFQVEVHSHDDNILQTYEVTPIQTRNVEQSLNTTELIKYYVVSDKIETMNTTDTIRLKNITRIISADVWQDEPSGTKIRYLFSLDNRNTWFSLTNNIMQIVDKNDIITQGMSKADLNTIYLYDIGVESNLDIMVGLQMTDELVSPIIHKIIIQY